MSTRPLGESDLARDVAHEALHGVAAASDTAGRDRVEPDRRLVAARLGGEHANPGPARLDGLEWLEGGVERVAEAGDAAERRFTVTADPDRHRPVDGLGLEADLGHLVELSRETGRGVSEERPEQFELLVGPLAAMVVRHAE